MCGISGFNWKDEKKVGEMVSCLTYRGPDADGIFTDEGISLGHNRLSVIDLSVSANQPMHDNANELVIVFNGEIYNFKDLKKELKDEYEFKTSGDTEVILAGYRKWGKGVVNKLNGMFALAIWDKRDKSLFCARDQAGVKPFYYFFDGTKFIFASEIPGILVHDIERKVNQEALNHYFRVLYTPEPLTLIENIFKLPPSHTLTLKDGKISVEKYGDEDMDKLNLSYREAVPLVRESVIKAVGRQLVSDVPVGVYLSGGIDSSSVLFSMTQFRSGIETFSVGFDSKNIDEAEKFNRDFELAKRTAKFFNTNHNTILVSADDVIKHFEETISHNSDPVSHPTSVAMLLLARYAKEKVTVALTGNGGDELFGGYERYKMALLSHYYTKFPQPLKSLLNLNKKFSKLDNKKEIDLFARFMFEKDKNISKIISPSIFKPDSVTKNYFNTRYFNKSHSDPAEKFMKIDQESWLPDYFFSLSDKMSMASGLEERVPLVDKELISLSKSLPRSYKVDLLKTKKILKDAFKNDLPEYLFNQPKMGWFAPGAKWLRDPKFIKMSKEVLSANYHQGTKSVFDWGALEKMLDNHIEKKEYNLTLLWAALTFQVWAKKFNAHI